MGMNWDIEAFRHLIWDMEEKKLPGWLLPGFARALAGRELLLRRPRVRFPRCVWPPARPRRHRRSGGRGAVEAPWHAWPPRRAGAGRRGRRRGRPPWGWAAWARGQPLPRRRRCAGSAARSRRLRLSRSEGRGPNGRSAITRMCIASLFTGNDLRRV